jgi:hypothetical protein
MPSYPIKGYQKIGMIAAIPEITSVVSPSVSINKTEDIRENCSGGSCSGESCISTYDGEPFTGEAKDRLFRSGQTRNINVILEVWEANSSTTTNFKETGSNPAKEEIYKIAVTNSGDVVLSDVEVSAVMAEGMKYKNSEYFDTSTHGKITAPTRDPESFDEIKKTRVAWNIGTLNPEETKSIILEAYIKPNVDRKAVSVKVTGNAAGSTVVRDSVESARPYDCKWMEKNGRQECKVEGSDEERLARKCFKACPENWRIK